MNWGNKLLVTFIVFAGMMGTLVYKSLHTNFELVEKDYYKSELRYQEVIDGANRANSLNNTVKFLQQGSALSIQMPEEMRNLSIKGDILFYCAYNASQDRRFELKPNQDGLQVIPREELLPGNYIVKMSWVQNELKYYTEKPITIQ